MKLVMTLQVRDEADVIREQLAFHLDAGVDFVIATDHRSVDGTTEILRSYERDGRLRLLREVGDTIHQSEWVTRMARLAAVEHGADWVINSDADEFWWPREGSLKDVLAAVPASYGAVRAVQRYFVPRPGAGWFMDRMTLRLAPNAAINDPGSSFRPVAKLVHRGHPAIVVLPGNHELAGPRLERLRSWSPIELLHFPLRSQEQAVRKYQNTWSAWRQNLRGDIARARRAHELGRPEAYYGRIVLDETSVARGLADGSLVDDTRLRDALRRIVGGASTHVDAVASRRGEPASFSDDVSRAVESSCLDEADEVRLLRGIDELEAKVFGLEQRPGRPRASGRRGL